MGDPKRIALVAADLVAHFEKRVEAMDGKAMIVCMKRIILPSDSAYHPHPEALEWHRKERFGLFAN